MNKTEQQQRRHNQRMEGYKADEQARNNRNDADRRQERANRSGF